MISQRARYAFKALLQLVRADGQSLSAAQISDADSIPRAFLDQILVQLRRAGLVKSLRGRNGGYVLACDPAAISLADVLRLVDGPIAPLPCLSKTAYKRCDECADEAQCALRHVFSQMYERVMREFEATPLSKALSF